MTSRYQLYQALLSFFTFIVLFSLSLVLLSSSWQQPVGARSLLGATPDFGTGATTDQKSSNELTSNLPLDDAKIYPNRLASGKDNMPDAPRATSSPILVSLASRNTFVPPQLTAGDLNGDNMINSLDWSVMNSQWLKTNSQSDINANRTVNPLDFSYLKNNWYRAGN